jgi:hypothetical protein
VIGTFIDSIDRLFVSVVRLSLLSSEKHHQAAPSGLCASREVRRSVGQYRLRSLQGKHSWLYIVGQAEGIVDVDELGLSQSGQCERNAVLVATSICGYWQHNSIDRDSRQTRLTAILVMKGL